MGILRKASLIERITVTGPMGEMKAELDVMHDSGFNVVRSGPYPVGVGLVDSERFKIIAEREVSGGIGNWVKVGGCNSLKPKRKW